MPVVESRVRAGVLSLAGTDFSCQPTSVAINPSVQAGGSGNELEVLCGDKVSETGTAEDFTATLDITAISDFANSAGIVSYSWQNNGKIVDFSWQPTSDSSDTWTGKVKVQAIQVGGNVGERLLPTISWEITELTMPSKYGGGKVIPYTPPAVPITGVTAGTPGSFQPGTATLPADLATLKANGNVGDTALAAAAQAAFGSGEYVVLGDASEANWDGSNWQQGRHP